ncbi:hypothetical protein HHI36_005020 [Cryptolaemus montrouzieri]|uniref:Uncharacterized protein n=1 Tax=Cryptolaemus montrouzieri TaxID=559131 RepID=A0ABD2NT59_9CUCU
MQKNFLSTFSDNYRRQNIQTATDIIQPQETNITHSRKGQKLLVQENLDKNGTTQNLIIEVNKGIDEFENLQEIEQYTEFQFLGDEKDQNGCDTMQFLSKNIVLRADDLLQHTSPEEVKKYSTRAIEKMSCSPMHSSTSSGLDKIDNDQLHESFQGAIVLSDSNQITKEFVEGSEKTKCFLKNTNTKTCFMQNLNFKESSKYDSNIFKESQDREIERVVSGQEEEIINNNSVTHTTPLKQFNEVLFQQRNHLESGNNPNILDSCSQENQFSKAHYELLKAVSSPLLVDLECNTYLKSLVDNEKKKKVSSDLFNNQSPIRNKQFNENFECYFMLPNEENIIHKSTKNTKNTKTSQVNFQEKECTQLWKTMLSQNQNSQSQISDSFNSKSINSLDESGISSQLLSTQNSNKDKIEISQGSCSEIFDYLSSQDFEDTNSIMTTALKNITNLSQTSMSRRSLSFICDQNSLKLLELAFQIYAQFKEKMFQQILRNPKYWNIQKYI